MNEAAATVATTVVAVGRVSCRISPATYPTTTSARAQRPATWSAGGARSSSSPAKKPSVAANAGPRTSAAATTTSRQKLGTIPSQAMWGKTATWRTRATTTIAAATAIRSGFIAVSRSSQCPVGLDHATVTAGARRDDDADQVERAEVDVRRDDGALRRL